MTSSAALAPFDHKRIVRALTLRVDEDAEAHLRAIRNGLSTLGLQPTSESDLIRFAVSKFADALDNIPEGTPKVHQDALRLSVFVDQTRAPRP